MKARIWLRERLPAVGIGPHQAKMWPNVQIADSQIHPAYAQSFIRAFARRWYIL